MKKRSKNFLLKRVNPPTPFFEWRTFSGGGSGSLEASRPPEERPVESLGRQLMKFERIFLHWLTSHVTIKCDICWAARGPQFKRFWRHFFHFVCVKREVTKDAGTRADVSDATTQKFAGSCITRALNCATVWHVVSTIGCWKVATLSAA